MTSIPYKKCDKCETITDYQCILCNNTTNLFAKTDNDIYCMYCYPTIVNFNIVDKYHRCIHKNTKNSHISRETGEINFNQLNKKKVKINGYSCYLCGGYDKYYCLIDLIKSEVVTYDKFIKHSDILLLCGGCSNGHFSVEKRDYLIYRLKDDSDENDNQNAIEIEIDTNIDSDIKKIIDVYKFKRTI